MWLLFRDDDLGWNPPEFSRLLTLFARYDQKLNAAAIPQALTDPVLRQSIPYSYQAAPFLQVVTHGYSHTNHEVSGKKAEFGSSRRYDEVRSELEAGRVFLAERFENYFPCFVPPWNRIDEAFLPLLPECGYRMLSRDEQMKARAPVPEFGMGLDLHSHKGGARLEAKEIFRELARRNEAGHEFTGVMLHHGLMKDSDFEVIENLLKELTKRSISTCFFSDLIPGFERRHEMGLSHV